MYCQHNPPKFLFGLINNMHVSKLSQRLKKYVTQRTVLSCLLVVGCALDVPPFTLAKTPTSVRIKVLWACLRHTSMLLQVYRQMPNYDINVHVIKNPATKSNTNCLVNIEDKLWENKLMTTQYNSCCLEEKLKWLTENG